MFNLRKKLNFNRKICIIIDIKIQYDLIDNKYY